ncbi:MAG: hypothetical protein IPK60_03170 [Sandaracinaceae bacterium]|nr:hypothetical protein [Sandaracinaceae bacterium]
MRVGDMKQARAIISFVCVALAIAGCGPATPTETTTPGHASADPFRAILVVGADTDLVLESDGTQHVHVRTAAVRELGGAHVASLVWSRGAGEGEPVAFLGAPSEIAVSPNGAVRFFFSQSDLEIARAISTGPGFGPLPTGQQSHSNERGGEVSRSTRPGELCFQENVTGNEVDCEGICFSRLCIWEGGGISELAGNWAPDHQVFRNTR